jgi:hypothetical protein
MAKQKTFFQQLALATILVAGFGVVIGVVVGWSTSIIESVIMTNPDVYQYINVMHDGTPIIRQSTTYGSGIYTFEYFAFDGQRIDVDKNNRYLDNVILIGSQRLAKLDGYPRYQVRIAPFYDREELPNYWYFVHDGQPNGKGYFVGYDGKSKQCIGYVGLQGSSSNLPPKELWFPVDGRIMQAGAFGTSTSSNDSLWYSSGGSNEFPSWKVIMASGDNVLEVNLRTGKVTTIFKIPNLLLARLLNSTIDGEASSTNLFRQYIVARTSERIAVLDAVGKQVASYAIPKDIQQATLEFYEIGKEKALITNQCNFPDFKAGEQLTWINSDGKILDRKKTELIGHGRHPMSKIDYWRAAVAIPSPIAMLVGTVVVGPFNYIDILENASFSEALGYSIKSSWQPIAVLFILGGVLAWFCYCRQRRFDQPWTWAWVLFVFLFGLPGFLGYLFHRRWPVMETCHVCGKAVPCDRENCSSCNSNFPLPAMKGIEVFAQ